MRDLRDKLDEVGWFNGPMEPKVSLIFAWMAQATREIEQLRREIEQLRQEVDRMLEVTKA